MLNQYSLTTRLIILCIFPILVLMLSYVIAIRNMQTLSHNTNSLYHDRIVPLRDLKQVSDSFAVEVVDAFQKFRAGILSLSELESTISVALDNSNRAWQRFLQTEMNQEERRLVATVQSRSDDSFRLINEFRQSAQSGQLTQIPAREFNTRLFGAFDPLSAAISELTDYQLIESSRVRQASEDQFIRDRNLFIFIGTLAILLTLVIAWRISASIQSPITRLVKTMSDITRHADLRLRVQVEGKDELAQLGHSFNQLIANFQKLIYDFGAVSHQLATSAEEMSMISQQVTGSARNQEDQSTMIATAINEMTAAIAEVATTAQSASLSADHANSQAKQGLSRTRQTIQMIESLATTINHSAARISELDTQARQISEVLDMIETIADQTNLLALNAAIEAARAGDAGRGFAVVADEVRNLAASTRQSTERIQDSIGKLQSVAQDAVKQMQVSNEAAQEGVANAKANGDAFETVGAAVATIVDMSVHISAATEEQTAVANDVNQNIQTVVSSVAEVVESAEQTALASQQLAKLAQQLKNQVEQYKV